MIIAWLRLIEIIGLKVGVKFYLFFFGGGEGTESAQEKLTCTHCLPKECNLTAAEIMYKMSWFREIKNVQKAKDDSQVVLK